MFKLVVLAAVLAFACASPGVVDLLSGTVGQLTNTVGQLTNTAGKTISAVLGGGNNVAVDINALISYFRDVLQVRRVVNTGDVCTCPFVLQNPYYLAQQQATVSVQGV